MHLISLNVSLSCNWQLDVKAAAFTQSAFRPDFTAMLLDNHRKIERNLTLMAVLILITISIGGLVEIIPLYLVKQN